MTNSKGIKKLQTFKPAFFKTDTCKIAEQLLGAYLVRQLKGKTLIGRIVETEAYLGLKDPSCHSFSGLKTNRTKTLYLSGGHSYIYFTYGMYYCFNVVTRSRQYPEAVLIRALEPLYGLEEMRKNRKKTKELCSEHLCSGPGKLCQALLINKDLNEINLTQKGDLFLAKGQPFKQVESDARVGLPWHKESSYWLLRFYAKDNPYVSKNPKTT